MGSLENVPTIELINALNRIESNIAFNKDMLTRLSGTKTILDKFDIDNKRVNKLTTKLNQLSDYHEKINLEMDKRAEVVLGDSLEIEAMNALQKEIDGKYMEASKIFQERQLEAQKAQQEGAQVPMTVVK